MIRIQALKFLMSALLIVNSSACIRVIQPDAPKVELEKLGPDPFRANRVQACSFAIPSVEDKSPNKSPESIFLAAQCYETGAPAVTDAVLQDRNKAVELYTIAAQCGLPDAEQKLTRLGLTIPERRTSPGLYYWPYGRLHADNCGYKEELTLAGVVTLVAVTPLLVAGAVVTTVVLVGVGLPLCVVYAVATKTQCM